MEEGQYKVAARITGIKGKCAFGHKVGETFELSGYTPDGLCGYFYHDIYPYIIMLEFGGKFPAAWSGEIMKFDCMDKENAVSIEMRRVD